MAKSQYDKHKYRKFKVSLMAKVLIAISIALSAGGFVIYYILGSKIPNTHIVFTIYAVIIALLAYYLVITYMTKFLDDVSEGVDNVIEGKYESIVLNSELEPVEKKLNELKIKLENHEAEVKQAENKKNDTILYLAHDLKTPLTSIIAYLNMLDTHPDMEESKRKEYLHVSYEKSLRLHQLIQEFFEITKFNLQGIQLEKEEFELDLMLAQISDELYGVLQEKNLTCKFSSDPKLKVHADPNKIARVFDNLLRNAVAYSYENSTIRIMSKDMGDNIAIAFTNNGPTIPKEDLENVFDKFYRADNSRSSKTGGAGLGLAIAKAIVEAHGGYITVRSANELIRFIVVIPKDNIK